MRPKGTVKTGQALAFSPEELSTWIKTLSKAPLKDRLMFGLTLYYGLRVSEVVTIRLVDISFHPPQITTRGLKHGLTRTDKLPSYLLRLLNRWLKITKPKEFLFPGRFTGDATSTAAQLRFYQLRDLAGLNKRFSIHSLRHTCAMVQVRNGKSPIFVQAWLRQKRLDSTLKYFRAIEQEKYSDEMAELGERYFK